MPITQVTSLVRGTTPIVTMSVSPGQDPQITIKFLRKDQKLSPRAMEALFNYAKTVAEVMDEVWFDPFDSVVVIDDTNIKRLTDGTPDTGEKKADMPNDIGSAPI